MDENSLSKLAINRAMKVHTALGPGLLESTYKECLYYELLRSGLLTEKEKPLPLIYEEVKLECGYRVDLFLERLPSSVRRGTASAVGLVSSAFLLVVAWAGLELAISNQAQESPVLTIPMSVPYFAIPLGLGLMALFTLAHAIRDLRGSQEGDNHAADEGQPPSSATDR